MKNTFHPRNCHAQGYDFQSLIKANPDLKGFLVNTPAGELSIDFGDPHAVQALNGALLIQDYNILGWKIPRGALCPPVPGRVDYVHHMADLLDEVNPSRENSALRMLDVGTGANGIYVLLAARIYGWQCVGSDVISESLDNVSSILLANTELNSLISLRLQADRHRMFEGVIQSDEYFDLTVCNPPFHGSEDEAKMANRSRVTNIGAQASQAHSKLSFGGSASELWCNGGERLFLKKMASESQRFKDQVHWFSSLVSKADNVKQLFRWLKKLGAKEVREIPLIHGNKKTRVVAWRF